MPSHPNHRPRDGRPQPEPRAASGGEDSDDLDALVDAYLAEVFEDSPAMATFQGWGDLHERSPDLSQEAIVDRERRADLWLQRFGALADDTLDAGQRVDRDLVLTVLRGEQIRRDWQVWRRNPDYYLNPALMGVFTLFLRRPLPEPELVGAAEARLRAVPGLLAAGRTNLTPTMVPAVFIDRARGQCKAGEAYARTLVPAEVGDPTLRARLADAGAAAAEAFASFGRFLDDLAERASGDWAMGETRYSALLRHAELLDLDATGLHARGQQAWDELDVQMTELTRLVYPDLPSWRDGVTACSQFHPSTPDEMRDAYAEETLRTRAFLAERGLVSFPEGERCEVVPSPPFQRPVLAVASYFQPPAFAPSRVGRFNVPYPPDGTPPEDVAKRLADNGYHTVPTITAHEAYPGHHWHLTTMQTASPIRRVHRSAYFTEGWGLYAERMMWEEGYFTDPRDELMHLNARIFRAARIVVDTALHAGEMTFDEAVAHMQQKAGLTEPVARTEVQRYCAWPTQAAAYLTGCLEIERIRDRWFAEGRSDLRAFHDTLAATGGLPLALAERAVFGP
jgi:uncharacterized protein (DUF885 family)